MIATAAARADKRAPATTLCTIARQEIEVRILDGLKERLLSPEPVAEFIAAYREEAKRFRIPRRAGQRSN